MNMKSKTTEPKKKKPIPPPGRKMSKEEAREYVFTKFAKTMELLAKH